MRFDIKEDGKRILMVCVASLIMALNIKTFVRTGGLYPGGATGLTILIQRVADLFFGIYWISVYRKEIYFVFLLDDPADRYPYRYDPGISYYLRYVVDQCVWRSH